MEVMLVSKENDLSSSLRRKKSVHWVQKPSVQIAQTPRRIFVLSPATKLPEYSDFLRIAIKHKRLCALFVYEDIESEWIPQMLSRAGIRPLRHMFIHKKLDLPERIISAWIANIQKQTIADATVIDDRLLILGCDLREYEVPFSKISALKDVSVEERSKFMISSDGSYIHWPESDVHLDLDVFRYVTDDTYREKVDRERLAKNKNFGIAIAKFRRGNGLRQTDIPGLSDRQVRRIEHGGSVTSNVVKALASAHNLTVKDYMDQLANILH